MLWTCGSDVYLRGIIGFLSYHRFKITIYTTILGRPFYGLLDFTGFSSAAMLRDSVRGPSCVALVRIHADLPGGCDLGAAVENYMRVSFAKVASQFAQHFIDVGSS